MYTRTSISVIAKTFLFVALIALAGACDNPAEDNEDDHDHAEVEGAILMVGGTEIVRVEEGEVSGEIEIEAGGSAVEIEVEWLDHDGDHIHGEDLDEEFSLGWQLEGDDVVTASQSDTWSISLTPVAAGETQFSVQLMHGGHPDFTTPNIHIHVE